MISKGKLTITLQSDLCVGSGYAYAGLIDSDVCFDSNGLPYIPARRIKGCLRQSAEDYLVGTLLTEEDIKQIFGATGDNAVNGISISNARIENFDAIEKELNRVQKNPLVTAEKILQGFTHIQGQTKLDEGIAVENTLRYTRVVNQKSPLEIEKNLTFVSDISIDVKDEEAGNTILEKIVDISKATRSIGLKRNRGLGNVKCEVTFEEQAPVEIQIGKGEADRVIEFTINNVEPLMISGASDNVSLKYIPGQNVLGLLAGAYIRSKGITSKEASTDEIFKDLFLSGTTIYTNLVPYESGKEFYPAPIYINKLKKTKKYVNVINKEEVAKYEDDDADKKTNGNQNNQDNDDYNPGNGNQPKKLNGKFVYVDEQNRVQDMEVKTKMVYHHKHRGISSGGEDDLLYCMETIEANQEFIGRIYTKEKYVSLIENLLKNSSISFGKSKTAQYGKCKLMSLSVNEKSQDIAAKDTIVVTLQSDGIFMNEKGEYTVYVDEVYGIIAKSLGIETIPIEDSKKEDKAKLKAEYPAMISTKQIVGYQSTWNMRKMPVPAICAGSCFIYRLKEPTTIKKTFVGERNLEGYGQIQVGDYTKMKYEVESVSEESDASNASQEIEYTKGLVSQILSDSILEDLKLTGVKRNTLAQISSSSLGRITLMLRESIGVNSESEKIKADFKKRIDSIKTESVHEEGVKIYENVTRLGKSPEEKMKFAQEQIELGNMLGISQGDLEKQMKERWYEYAMTILTLQKYEKAIDKKEGDSNE